MFYVLRGPLNCAVLSFVFCSLHVALLHVSSLRGPLNCVVLSAVFCSFHVALFHVSVLRGPLDCVALSIFSFSYLCHFEGPKKLYGMYYIFV